MYRVRFAAALLLLAAASAEAQSRRSETIRRQAVALDSAVARGARARVLLEAFDDSVSRSRLLLDTIRAGALRVLVSRPLRERVERVAPAAFAYLDSVAGRASARAANRWVVVRPVKDSVTDTLRVLGVTGRQEWSHLWGNPSDSTLARWIGTLAVKQLAEELKREFTAWIPREMTPDTATAATWAAARLDLVSTPTTMTHACYAGNLNACKEALRLVPSASRPATDWMDAKGRRWFFIMGPGRAFGRFASENQSCVDGDDAQCRRLLAAVDFTDSHVTNVFPTTPLVRSTIPRLAVQLGGRDGYERLIQASDRGPAEAIAAAAGMPLDSVVARWHARIHDTRLPSQDMSFIIAGSSLAWILVCGALSLRSSRWR